MNTYIAKVYCDGVLMAEYDEPFGAYNKKEAKQKVEMSYFLTCDPFSTIKVKVKKIRSKKC